MAVDIWVCPEKAHLLVGQSLSFVATISDFAGNILSARTATPTLKVGSLKQVKATIGDSAGRTGKVLSWSSNRPSLVKVDEQGYVTALAAGNAMIIATFEGQSRAVEVTVSDLQTEELSVSPIEARLLVGESLIFSIVSKTTGDKVFTKEISWRVDPPSKASIDANGFLTATAPGDITIIAETTDEIATATLQVIPVTTIYGLDFPGSAKVRNTMRFEFDKPLPAFPATYIWHLYPRQQKSYYTAFFWGNNGAFFPSNTFYGFHPYPDWQSESQHFWEIAAPPGKDVTNDSNVIYDRWYTQVAICWISEASTIHEFYWDWPDMSKVIRYSVDISPDPPAPVLAVGDAPWNPGHEVWNGVLRGFQFYDKVLTLSEIEQEIKTPGSVQLPWYLNLNPTPENIVDQSGSGHHPMWVGPERPILWQGLITGGTAIQTAVSPR
ncbi:Ig-like domain-containing protein [Desulfuromusa kysingii]|nr:Ig-like domain-containing protein [Desulfuromusa kysingii]